MNIKDVAARMFGESDDDADQAPDALALIKSDHREVDEMFSKALADDTPAAQRRTTIAKICEALTVHAKMEEALFYPALRKAGGRDERDSVLEANEEHGLVKDLIAKIRALPPRDETMEAKVTVLKEIVHHHVKEEESEIFSEARKVLGAERLQRLGEEMQRFKDRALRGTPSRNGKSSPAKRSAAKPAAAKRTPAKRGAKKAAPKRGTASRKK